MNILFCNERFLFRFGVDRVLILLGHGLKDRGHRISVMANRLDPAIVESFAEKVITVPEDGDSYLNLNEFTAQWLQTNWSNLFEEHCRPEVVVIGGWPFLLAIPVFQKLGVSVVFSDHGVVPLTSYTGVHRTVLEKLVTLRQDNIGKSDAIIAVSQFIAESQSKKDAPYSSEVFAVLNGANHLDYAHWDASSVKTANSPDGSTIEKLLNLKKNGVKVILNLGRWEPRCYKNSEAIFELVDNIAPIFPLISVLILSNPLHIEIPDNYRGKVIPIGFPDDKELQKIMNLVDLGVTVSLWEGFNLPLAEMQWLNRPVLAFDIGAHPEVVIHPWFLCQDIADMAFKARQLLTGGGLDLVSFQNASKRFHSDFGWQGVVDQYESVLDCIVHRSHASLIEILVDVTNASRDPANSGVIRVTRRICRELQRYCKPLFVVWNGEEQGYVFPTRSEYLQLSQYNGPVIDQFAPFSTETERLLLSNANVLKSTVPTWLLLTETILEVNGKYIRKFASEATINIGAIFYDAIPLQRPDLVKDKIIADNHAHYMKGLANCDLIIPISEFSAQSLCAFWKTEGLQGCKVITNLLPGEFGGVERHTEVTENLTSRVDLLCVSTLEPRKNHRRLIEAVNLFARQNPELDWSLTLVGNRYAGGEDIAEFVESACRANLRIQWLGIIDDVQLHQAYKNCTFTIYASEIEGFGMPILESIWHGKPCICHEQGVMSELARVGGCFTSDVTDVVKLARSIGELATNNTLYRRLVNEATSCPIKTWEEYVRDFWNALVKRSQIRVAERSQAIERPSAMTVGNLPDSWQDLLYSGCLTKEWQMNDSERLGLAGVLQRLQPNCAIEIGTYRGGSLSLIAQFAKVVFSIDIDPSIPERFKQFGNVSFFTGPSQVIMPALLNELDAAGMPVEFVLIDGDHSATGVKRDIEIMLSYVPKKPLIIMMHDGFNPECRRGMLEADWKLSPFVHYIDLDFIPGRVIEHGGGGDGEMWGGLAMAYFSPEKRVGHVHIGATAGRTYADSKERIYG
jgi:glycosyltransferase involved in cell wall biosynthesis